MLAICDNMMTGDKNCECRRLPYTVITGYNLLGEIYCLCSIIALIPWVQRYAGLSIRHRADKRQSPGLVILRPSGGSFVFLSLEGI